MCGQNKKYAEGKRQVNNTCTALQLCPRYGDEELYVMYLYVVLQEKKTFKNRKKKLKRTHPYARDSGLSGRKYANSFRFHRNRCVNM